MGDEVILFLQELRKWTSGQTRETKASILRWGLFTWVLLHLGTMLMTETSKLAILLAEHAFIIELAQILLILFIVVGCF